MPHIGTTDYVTDLSPKSEDMLDTCYILVVPKLKVERIEFRTMQAALVLYSKISLDHNDIDPKQCFNLRKKNNNKMSPLKIHENKISLRPI